MNVDSLEMSMFQGLISARGNVQAALSYCRAIIAKGHQAPYFQTFERSMEGVLEELEVLIVAQHNGKCPTDG